jgi:hypothetical protein
MGMKLAQFSTAPTNKTMDLTVIPITLNWTMEGRRVFLGESFAKSLSRKAK